MNPTALPHCSMTSMFFCPEVTVGASCLSGQEGIEAIARLKPLLVCLDIPMPLMTGFEMLERIAIQHNIYHRFRPVHAKGPADERARLPAQAGRPETADQRDTKAKGNVSSNGGQGTGH